MRRVSCWRSLLTGVTLAVLTLALGGSYARAQVSTSVSAGGPYAGTVGALIPFTGGATPAAGAAIVSYTWAFGDGTTANGATAQHAYAAPGVYTVTLTIQDSGGGVATATSSATINGQALPCAGAAAGITTGAPCPSSVLCGSAAANLSSSGCFNPSACTTIIGPGTPVFVSCGAAAQAIQVNAGGPYTGTAQQPLNLAGSGSFNPSSSCPLPPTTVNGRLTCPSTGAVIVEGAAPVSYRWNFGDGQIDFGPVVSHTYQAAGVYIVALTVNFADGSVGSGETTATIAAPLPARSLSLFSGCNDVSLTFPDGTAATSLAAAVSGGALVSIWKQTGPTSFAGWFPGAGTPSDLTTVNRLDAVFICLQGAGSLNEPGA
jgi:PKD repeat protein